MPLTKATQLTFTSFGDRMDLWYTEKENQRRGVPTIPLELSNSLAHYAT